MKRSPKRVRAMVAGAICATTMAFSVGPLVATAGAAAAAPAPVQCPAAAGNARFVRFIYFQILGTRCAGSAASAYWTAKLDGGMSRFAFAQAIDTSSQNLLYNNAIPIYQGLLGRDPTVAEARAVAQHIVTDHEDGVIVATLASSDEFYAINPPAKPAATNVAPTPQRDQTWLTEAYMGIVDRAPDSHGRAYFTGVLHANGPTSTVATRYQVAHLLERSAENAHGWTAAVFFAGLNRPPDPAGFAYWSHWLQTTGHWQTFTMWTHILSSDEGYRYAQTQPNPQAPQTAKGNAHRLGAFGKS